MTPDEYKAAQQAAITGYAERMAVISIGFANEAGEFRAQCADLMASYGQIAELLELPNFIGEQKAATENLVEALDRFAVAMRRSADYCELRGEQ